MEPYYDVVTFQTYVDVDPVNARGENLMDAGRLVFKEAGEVCILQSLGEPLVERLIMTY